MSIQQAKDTLSNGGFFQHWMPESQRVFLMQAVTGEEGSYFVRLLAELRTHIEAMPESYETDGIGMDAVVQLRYFGGSVDAWITEKDMGTPDDLITQHQAFGRITLTGNKEDAEFGYISIEELINNGIELDLHWELKKLKEL